MADLNKMLLVLMYYQRTETEMVRRSVITDIMEALVDREKAMIEARVIESMDKLMATDRVTTITMDRAPNDSRYVTVNLGLGDSKEKKFNSWDSLIDALAQCVHTLNNEPK